jgi:hypothetical protein
MAYTIAVATSDGVNIDMSFGAASTFDIYAVEGTEYHLLEKREYIPTEDTISDNKDDAGGHGCGGRSYGCGTGCSSEKTGAVFSKVQLISDCRCVVCKKIGFQVQRRLEKMAIVSFDVECTLEEALTKITAYFDKRDHHRSLRVKADPDCSDASKGV